MFTEKYSEEIRKMMKVGVILLGLIAIFFVFQILSDLKEYRYIGKGVYPARTINVTGSGEVYAIPDVGEFTFTVQERADTVEAAQTAAVEKANAAIEAIKALGVEEKDIKTQSYYVNPRYEYLEVQCITFPCPGRETLAGYEVTQTMSVKVRDLDQSGELITAATNAGATGVSGLSFTIDDLESVKADARELAIADAKAKAERLEDDLDVSFIRISGFFENDMPMYYEERAVGYGGDMAMSAKAPAPTLPSGENQVTATVTLVYEIR